MKKGRSNDTSAEKAFGLPKADILRGRTNFKRLFEGSATVYSEDTINLRFRIYTGEETACKMGFIVAKRLGKANRRNHAKRLLKEAYRLQRHSLTESVQAASVLFHGALTAKTVESNFTTAEQEVMSLLNRAVEHLQSRFGL